MNDYRSNITLDAAAKRLMNVRKLLVVTHAKPDGDAFGSVVALTAAMRLFGTASVSALLAPPVPSSFAELAGGDIPAVYKPGDVLPEHDLAVVLDTGAWAQLAPLDALLRPSIEKMLILDHHQSGDVPAAWRYVNVHAAACCEVVADVLDRMAADIGGAGRLYGPVVCEALFVGLVSDTGWFRFSNTSPRTHELAAMLLRAGVNQDEVFRKLEQSDRPEKLALMIRALHSLRLLADGKAAIMVLRRKDFEETGALLEETERLIDAPRAVAGVEVVALVTETPGKPGQAAGPIRISFRSKPGPSAVNVSQMAAQFGGGGHARAAGAKLQAPLDEAVRRVEQALETGVAD